MKALKYIKNLQNYDVLIFTSQSAVIHGAKFFKEALVANKKIPILAIGLATQESLNKFNLDSSIPPTFDSAGLALVIKEMGYKKCLVFCGDKNPRIISLTRFRDRYISLLCITRDETILIFQKLEIKIN